MATSPTSILRSAALGLVLLPFGALAQVPTIGSFTPTSGSSGQVQAPASDATVVTITGTNLTSVQSVLINGQQMPIVVGSNTATQVKAVIPRGALTGKLRVTTALGTVLSATALTVTRPVGTGNFRLVSSSFNGIDVGDYSTAASTDLDHDGLIDMLLGDALGNITRYEQSALNSLTFVTVGPVKLSDGTTLNNNNVGNTRQFAKPVVADIDGDGLLDMLVGAQDGIITRYEQSAVDAATFIKIGDLPMDASDVVKPSIVDLDNNGLLDMIVGAADGTLRRYEQTSANGPFGTTAALLTAGGATLDVGNYSKPVFTDIDGDGLIDMIVGNQDGRLYRTEQTAVGAATFAALALITDASGTALDVGDFSAPSLTDVDGDGYLDLLVGNALGNVYQLEQIVSVARPLPVTLTDFTANPTATGTQLRWNTAQEVNSARFVVERSVDGRAYKAVAELPAAGTSTTPRAYQYQDAGTSPKAYYRLRAVDTDGTEAYSAVVVVNRSASTGAAAGLTAYPNPFTDKLVVALPAGAAAQVATLTLASVNGTVVWTRQQSLSATPQELLLPALRSGLYVLRLTTAAGTSTQRVVRR